jgi:hypothetical protein
MKGKMTIVLLSLVLVFGMIAASCDDGDFPANPYKDQTGNDKKQADDFDYSYAAPWGPSRAFKDKEGITTGIGAQGSGSFSGGIIGLSSKTSALFTITLPDYDPAATNKTIITIKYVTQNKKGDIRAPKLTLKNGGWGDIPGTVVISGTTAATSADKYPALDQEGTLVLRAGWFTDPTKIAFQRNDWSDAKGGNDEDAADASAKFEMKITSIAVSEES